MRRCATDLGLPPVLPASELHRQMLSAAEAFSHPQGWPGLDCVDVDLTTILNVLSTDVRGRVAAILGAGCRIPEEVLGPAELRSAWSN